VLTLLCSESCASLQTCSLFSDWWRLNISVVPAGVDAMKEKVVYFCRELAQDARWFSAQSGMVEGKYCAVLTYSVQMIIDNTFGRERYYVHCAA
jgi:hypothetical protein